MAKKAQEEKELEIRKETHQNALNDLVEDGKMLDRQKDDIMAVYEEDVLRLQMNHNEGKAENLFLIYF